MRAITVEESLRFDSQIKSHASREDAITYAVGLLVAEGGWSTAPARETIAAGRVALVRDDGDDWTIEVREIEG